MKKILKTLVGFFCFAIIFVLTSCSDSKVFGVVSFKTESSSYTAGDSMSFIITLNNDDKYDIVSCIINDSSYVTSEIGFTKEKYSVSTDIKYNPTNIYVLKEITYMVDGSSKTLALNKKAVVGEAVSYVKDVTVKEVSFNPIDNEEIFVADEVIAEVNLAKKSTNITILSFYFTFTDANNAQETKKISIIDNDTDKTNVTYSTKIQMPNMAGAIVATVSKIDYADGTKFNYMNQNEVIDQLMVSIHDVSVESAKVLPKTALEKDVNDCSYFDSSSSIDIEIQLKNESNLDITEIVVSGSKVNISKDDIKKYELLEKMIITKTINLDVEESPIKLTLDSVTYTKNGKPRKINQQLIKEDYYYYNKIIRTAQDFNEMMIDEKTNRIVGRYIVANDITLTGKERYLFNDYTLDGTIEFNGRSITTNTLVTKPMFEKISEKGCVQNLLTNYSANNTPIICNGNYGEINNVKIISSITSPVCNDVVNPKITYIICNTNALSGKIKNIDIASQLTGSHSFFGIMENNYGELKNVIVNPSQFEANSNTLFALPTNNNGEVSSVLILVENWFTGLEASDVSRQNNLIIETTNNSTATYKNIIVSQEFINQINTFNKVIEGPTSSPPTTFGKLVELEGKTPYNKIIGMLSDTSAANSVPKSFRDFLGFETPRKTWNSYICGSISDTELTTTIKEFSRSALSENLTEGLGFIKYADGNNSFWRNSSGSVTINFVIK